MIQAYLRRGTEKIAARFADDVSSRAAWEAKRPQYLEEYLYMLGLSPRPEKTPLRTTITRTLRRDDYVVDMLHYQSQPGLYVTGNLYRPALVKQGERLPAVLYVCGHSHRGRNGNKVAYQSHGIWFARHGYVCLVVDTLQLGEIAAFHHGTYNLQRWWWHSRGYTPAGVEAWNGIRGLDYLVSRPDVDPERLAVTGISGGGAATFWIAAADERVKVAVPVSGMADLESYVPNRVINGHCDCMFLYNAFQWPWTRIAGLIAPRPLLCVNSDQDAIFPMDANERVISRLERLYSLFGAGDRVDAVVSVGGHAYRRDIREAVYRFINTHLKGDPRPASDTEVDLVSEGSNPGPYPIPPEELRVFPTDADLPADQVNTAIDARFVPLRRVPGPASGQYDEWKRDLLARLRQASFRYFPHTIPPAKKLADTDALWERMQSEEGIEFRLRFTAPPAPEKPASVLVVVLNESEAGTTPDWVARIAAANQAVVLCEPRGIGPMRWTRKNPPNYVERAHALLGRTVDAGRVWDVIAAARAVPGSLGFGGRLADLPVQVAGSGAAGVIAAYAAALDDRIAGVTLLSPPATHMDASAPRFLNVLRVCDTADALGLIAPRPLTLVGVDPGSFAATASAYDAAGARERLSFSRLQAREEGMSVAAAPPRSSGTGATRARGPLRVHPDNPRYFTDGSKAPDGLLKAVYLTGSHTWNNLVDMRRQDAPEPFDFDGYLKFLDRYGHNFIRLWTWDSTVWDTRANGRLGKDFVHHVAPLPWARTGPGTALDGKPRFDLTKFDAAYFERLRRRVRWAGDRGIYVLVMLFEGWGLMHANRGRAAPEGWAWQSHPFNPENNVNGLRIEGADRISGRVHRLGNAASNELQTAYIRRVVDTLNDLDNVLFEVINEGGEPEWDWWVVRTIRDHERAKPKQHPVGITGHGAERLANMLASPADWVSPGRVDGYGEDPPAWDARHRKVSLLDTDHIWGVGGSAAWVWKSFLRGHNPLFMDPYDGSVLGKPADESWEPIRRAMGQTARLAQRIDLATMSPSPAIASTTYCLGSAGKEYLVYLPDGGAVTVDLSAAKGDLAVEWFDPGRDRFVPAGRVAGGARREFKAPFASAAVLYLRAASM